MTRKYQFLHGMRAVNIRGFSALNSPSQLFHLSIFKDVVSNAKFVCSWRRLQDENERWFCKEL